jgi:hypothetical protein
MPAHRQMAISRGMKELDFLGLRMRILVDGLHGL